MMDHDAVISLYESVSDLTGQMLTAAQQRDWENLVALEAACSARVAALKHGEPATPLSGETRSRKVAIIRQILAHDRAIRDLTTPWMAQLAALIGNAGSERKLAMSYGSHEQF